MGSVLDDLLAESAPLTGRGSDKWEFTASTKRVFKCRIPRGADEIEKILKGGANLTKLTRETSLPSWHPYLPISSTIAQGVGIITGCVIEPAISELDALKLAKERGAYFLEIVGTIRKELVAGHLADEEATIERLGETCGQMADGSSDSASQETPSENTSTNSPKKN